MRFRHVARYVFEDTHLKRLAQERSLRRQRDAFPLLAPLIAEAQPSVDVIMESRAAKTSEGQMQDRAKRARSWRAARSRLSAYPDDVRLRLLTYWNEHRWLPADPEALADMMNSWDRGTLALPDVEAGFRFERVDCGRSIAKTYVRKLGGWIGYTGDVAEVDDGSWGARPFGVQHFTPGFPSRVAAAEWLDVHGRQPPMPAARAAA